MGHAVETGNWKLAYDALDSSAIDTRVVTLKEQKEALLKKRADFPHSAGRSVYEQMSAEVAANDQSNGATLTLDATDAQLFTVYANAANGATLRLTAKRAMGSR